MPQSKEESGQVESESVGEWEIAKCCILSLSLALGAACFYLSDITEIAKQRSVLPVLISGTTERIKKLFHSGNVDNSAKAGWRGMLCLLCFGYLRLNVSGLILKQWPISSLITGLWDVCVSDKLLHRTVKSQKACTHLYASPNTNTNVDRYLFVNMSVKTLSRAGHGSLRYFSRRQLDL